VVCHNNVQEDVVEIRKLKKEIIEFCCVLFQLYLAKNRMMELNLSRNETDMLSLFHTSFE
jgi:hypothetical protein